MSAALCDELAGPRIRLVNRLGAGADVRVPPTFPSAASGRPCPRLATRRPGPPSELTNPVFALTRVGTEREALRRFRPQRFAWIPGAATPGRGGPAPGNGRRSRAWPRRSHRSHEAGESGSRTDHPGGRPRAAGRPIREPNRPAARADRRRVTPRACDREGVVASDSAQGAGSGRMRWGPARRRLPHRARRRRASPARGQTTAAGGGVRRGPRHAA
jgi:hypothetical protein